MTRGHKLALAGVVVGLGLAAAPAVAAAPPVFDYAWSQPPASVPIGPVKAFHPVSYVDGARAAACPDPDRLIRSAAFSVECAGACR